MIDLTKFIEEAHIYSFQENRGQFVFDDFSEKLAELIVKECAKFLEENSGYDACNNAWHPEPEDLLQHFGINYET
jgi:hypothetical protein